ncbi:MAG: pyridoxamine 5'-phosphate oxidase family protein [Spirochaetes bacterium]|nr:pyridoxamine 5'-phosphate oxidase family protein [Spirochaetota bacterium]
MASTNQEIFKKISDFLQEHDKITLATVSKEGLPVAHTVSHVNDGPVVYFTTLSHTRKIANIQFNPNIAYAIDDQSEDIKNVRGIQMQGKAEIIKNQGEMDKVLGLINSKFPSLPRSVDTPNLVVVKITPVKGMFLDNTIEVGYRKNVEF